MSKDKDCVVCGNRFTPHTGNQKLCSYKCRVIYYGEEVALQKSLRRTVTQCANCGKPLELGSNRRKYCSDDCRKEATKKRNGKWKRTYDSEEDKRCTCTRKKSCYYGKNITSSLFICDYAEITGKIRGGYPADCTHYKRKAGG